jgi:hypothetical protein
MSSSPQVAALRTSHQQATKILTDLHAFLGKAVADESVFADLNTAENAAHKNTIAAVDKFLIEDGANLEMDFDALERELASTAATHTPQQRFETLLRVLHIVSNAVHTHEAKAAGWAAIAMLAKNFLVWNGPRFAARGLEKLLPNDMAKIAVYTTISVVCAVIEYLAQGKAHQELRKTGRTLPLALAAVQGMDVATSLPAYALAGDKLRWQDGLVLAASVVGVLIGSGAMQRSRTASPIAPIIPGTARIQEEPEVPMHDPEAGAVARPRGKHARDAAVAIRRLVDTFPDERMALAASALNKYRMQTAGVLQEVRARRETESQTERMAELDNFISHLEACIARMDALVPGNADDAATVNRMQETIKFLEQIKESELDPAGGKDPLKMAFYAVLTAAYFGSVISDVWVRAYDTRALKNILASSLPQMPANLIPAALPKDMSHWAKTLVALSITPFEFGPLQGGYHYAKEFQRLADAAGLFAKDGASFLDSLTALSPGEQSARAQTLATNAIALARECGTKAPGLTTIIEQIATEAGGLAGNPDDARGTELVRELAVSIKKLATEGHGKPDLIPNARGFQELIRIGLQLVFARVELHQKLEAKDYASLGVPLVVALALHIPDWAKKGNA